MCVCVCERTDRYEFMDLNDSPVDGDLGTRDRTGTGPRRAVGKPKQLIEFAPIGRPRSFLLVKSSCVDRLERVPAWNPFSSVRIRSACSKVT